VRETESGSKKLPKIAAFVFEQTWLHHSAPDTSLIHVSIKKPLNTWWPRREAVLLPLNFAEIFLEAMRSKYVVSRTTQYDEAANFAESRDAKSIWIPGTLK
jgi:hypothetical protein